MDPEVNATVRATGTHAPPGVYRVVGHDDETVRLLQVGDADGARAVTGTLLTVEREAFEEMGPAPDPVAEFAPVSSLRSAVEGWVALVSNRL
jgi:hypothetical protein